MSSGTLETGLSTEVLDIHRALASLQEELEAIDYYHQRVDATSDESLKAILAHNRDDEMEHATMLMEWLRRTMPGFDVQMKKLLFTSGDLTVLAKEVKPPAANGSGLGLGNLK
jgi:ferritin-like protein